MEEACLRAGFFTVPNKLILGLFSFVRPVYTAPLLHGGVMAVGEGVVLSHHR